MFFPLNLRVPTSRASIQESKLEVTLYAIKFDVSAEFVNVVFLSDCLGLVKGFHDQYSYIHYSILSVLDTTKVLCTKYNYTNFFGNQGMVMFLPIVWPKPATLRGYFRDVSLTSALVSIL